MSNKPVVFCRDCLFSEPDKSSSWQLRCHNPEVNRKDSWALSASEISSRGTDCHGERMKTSWFAMCGMKGKRYQENRSK